MFSPSEYAVKIHRDFNLSGCFNIDMLVERIGGHIKYISFLDVDAMIKKHGDSFIILVDAMQPKTRQRFSIAHELGHLFLHLGFDDSTFWNSVKDEDSTRFRDGISFEEREANQFAAELLMPKSEFKMVSYNNLIDNIYYIDSIAEYFGTSVDAVKYRGINLGLWN